MSMSTSLILIFRERSRLWDAQCAYIILINTVLRSIYTPDLVWLYTTHLESKEKGCGDYITIVYLYSIVQAEFLLPCMYKRPKKNKVNTLLDAYVTDDVKKYKSDWSFRMIVVQKCLSPCCISSYQSPLMGVWLERLLLYNSNDNHLLYIVAFGHWCYQGLIDSKEKRAFNCTMSLYKVSKCAMQMQNVIVTMFSNYGCLSSNVYCRNSYWYFFRYWFAFG